MIQLIAEVVDLILAVRLVKCERRTPSCYATCGLITHFNFSNSGSKASVAWI